MKQPLNTRFRFLLLLVMLLSSWAWADQRPTVVATFSVLEDFAAEVAGDHARVLALTPRGAEVHEYELRPADFRLLESADLVFFNGWNLELWMDQVRAVVGRDVAVVAVAEQAGVDPLPIIGGEFGGEPDPHVWMDPRRAAAMVELMYAQLAELMPEHADSLRVNADAFLSDLDALYEDMVQAFEVIAPDHRVLITSEAAFVYFAEAFDFFHDAIWGSNAEVEGSPRQIMRITNVIQERRPPAIFWESTVSSRQVESISADTGVPVRGPLYVDSLGPPDGSAASYIDMMQENLWLLTEALADGH